MTEASQEAEAQAARGPADRGARPRRPRLPAARRDVQGHHAAARRRRGVRRVVEAHGRRVRAGRQGGGIEARGFILAAPVAYRDGAGFVPVRKQGKLPSATFAQEYKLEYGTATVEVHQDAFEPGDRVLIVDDVLATGGTARATATLVERSGAEVVGDRGADGAVVPQRAATALVRPRRAGTARRLSSPSDTPCRPAECRESTRELTTVSRLMTSADARSACGR